MGEDRRRWDEAYGMVTATSRPWAIVPGSRESYVAAFEGTFLEALTDAAKSAAFWKSPVTIWETDPTKYRRQGWMVRPWAVVRIPGESPLRS